MAKAIAEPRQAQQQSSDRQQPLPEDATLDNWSDKNQRIVVATPPDGYLFDLQLHAKIDSCPADVYRVLIDPDSPSIFRGIKQVLHREILEDDGAGRRKLLVAHRALTRFLWLSVTFDTHLYVWEDDRAMTIKFTNAGQDGFMRKFEGSWALRPFSQASVDEVFSQGQQQQQPTAGSLPSKQQGSYHQQQHHHWHLNLPFWHHSGTRAGQQQPRSTLVTLEQALAPRATPPGPLQPLVRGLCGRVLHNMMGDLRQELQRRQEQAAAGAAPDRQASMHKKHAASSSSSSTVLPVASLNLADLWERGPSWEVYIKL